MKRIIHIYDSFNSYQLASPARPANQTSFYQLDVGLQELSCRAAVQKGSAETLRPFSGQLRRWRLLQLNYPVFLPNGEASPISSNMNEARLYTNNVNINISLNAVVPHHSGVLPVPAVPEPHELLTP